MSTAKKKRSTSAQRAALRDAQTISELALGLQDSFPYETEQHVLAEQIYELANKLENSLTEEDDAPAQGGAVVEVVPHDITHVFVALGSRGADARECMHCDRPASDRIHKIAKS